MRVLRDFPLHRFRAAAWWLGRASAAVRFRGGPTLLVNPDLRPRPDGGHPIFPAGTLAAEAVLFTGPSADEVEPGTLAASPLPAHADCFGPPDAIARLAAAGVRAARPKLLGPGATGAVKGLTIRALPSGAGAGSVGGYLVSAAGATVLVATPAGRLGGAPPASPVHAAVVPVGDGPATVRPAAAAALIRQIGARRALVGAEDEAVRAALGAAPALRVWAPPILEPLAVAEDGTPVPADGQLAMRWDCRHPVPDAPLPPGYVLRAFRESDLPGLGALYTAAFGPWRTADWYRETFVASPLFAPERAFVVEHGGRPVATALAWDDPAGPGVGLVHFVATDPAEQAKGLGRAVSTAVMRFCQARGYREVRLTTDDYRIRALRAYRSLGFEPVEDGPGMALRWANVRDAIAAGDRASG